MKEEPLSFTAYITVSAGRGLKEDTVYLTGQGDMVKSTKDKWNTYYRGEGREWHRTREAAVSRWEVLRKAKLSSLRKQVAKLEAMNF